MLLMQRGVTHRFLVLFVKAEFIYKCDDICNPDAESGLFWNDKDVNIKWLIGEIKVEILTSKCPSLEELQKAIYLKN